MNNPGKQATLRTSHRTKKNNKITQKALKDYQNGPHQQTHHHKSWNTKLITVAMVVISKKSLKKFIRLNWKINVSRKQTF